MTTAGAESKGQGRFPPGTEIDGRYTVTGFLGKGGFANVYRAKQLHIDRQVAVKVLGVGHHVDNAEEFEGRFLREAKLAAQINHPNVVTIFDFGFAGPLRQPYIAMEMLNGHDLTEELKKNGPLDVKRAIVLYLKVLEALGEGHALGIVHKDLKPANLFVSNPDSARELLQILDFGVARLQESEDDTGLTATGQIIGTPKYLPPEYIRAQIATPALDVYQMGLILVESMTGIAVVNHDSQFNCLMAHCKGDLDIPDRFFQGHLGQVIRKATHIDYKQRYQNADEFLLALKEVDPDNPWGPAPSMPEDTDATTNARPSLSSDPSLQLGPVTSSPDLAPADAVSTSGSLDVDPFFMEGQPNNNNKTIAIVAVVLIVLLGVILVVFLSGGDESGESNAQAAAAPEQPTAQPPETQAGAQTGAEQPENTAQAGAGSGEPTGAGGGTGETDSNTEGAAGTEALDKTPDAGGPATPPAPTGYTINVTSAPIGSEVLRDGTSVGQTPLELEIQGMEPVSLVVSKNKYKSQTINLSPDAPSASVTLKKKKKKSGSSSSSKEKDGGGGNNLIILGQPN